MAPPSKRSGLKRPKETESDKITDPRFTNIQTDPRFRLPSRKNTHVQIDKRFSRMLRDDGFSSKAKVDRYGRKLPKDNGRRELEKFYRLEDNEDELSDDDREVERELERVNAADESDRTSSSDDSSSEDESAHSTDDEEVFGLQNESAAGSESVPIGRASPRIAVVNLDWDNIRATDLMAVFSSFVPSGGRILKISVFPSDFGRERMEREETEGPPKEIFGQNTSNPAKADVSSSEHEDSTNIDGEEGNDDDDERIKESLLREDKGEEFNSTKLRRYQLERLRYYFAVIICSSTPVAQAIYDAVDGTEYLTTANFFDLRFVPDDVDFSADKPRDECERIPDGYKPNDFVTDALQHSKVRLTWDADDGARKEVQKRAFGGSRADIDENDLKAYIGSDSSDDEIPQPVTVVDATANNPSDATAGDTAIPPNTTMPGKKENERQRMRALLGLKSEAEPKATSKSSSTNAPVGDMQITFSSGLTSTQNGSVFENEPERDETTVEKYIRKEKERKTRRKEKMKASRAGASNGTAALDNDADNAAKAPSDQENLGFSDPFFTAPATNSKSLKDRKRAQRRGDRGIASPEAATRREQLESLLKEDSGANNGEQIQHFDTTLLAKAEKLAAKKGGGRTKKHKVSERQKEALEARAKDDFRIDTQDPRFSAVFERSEFAIDPSHKGFKGTEGMKTLLEAGRKRRRRPDELDGDLGLGDRVEKKEKDKKRKKGTGNEQGEDVRRLVEKVKRRAGVA